MDSKSLREAEMKLKPIQWTGRDYVTISIPPIEDLHQEQVLALWKMWNLQYKSKNE